MITTAIVFDHRGRTKRGEEGPLEVRLTIERHSYYVGTGVRVRKNQWRFNQVVDHPHADMMNERLGILLARVMEIVNHTLKAGEGVKAEKIKRDIWNAVNDSSMIVWIKNEINILGVREGTRKHYDSLVRRLEDYGHMLSWGDLTVENIYKWDAWLRKLPGRGQPMTMGAVHNYHKCLKALLARAERSGVLDVNPYHRLRGEFGKGDRESTEYLTEEEMERIMKLQPAPGTWMERARDLFVFQMWTGLSYSDAEAFDISEYKQVDGKWRKIGERIKTGQPFVNQLLPPAVAVLEKYGMKVPQIVNQVYNRELKDVGMAAGISTPLHSHLARHTFATYMLRNGVKIENLAKMLGHANIKHTQRYAKVLAESVHEDFDMIERKMEEKKAAKEKQR